MVLPPADPTSAGPSPDDSSDPSPDPSLDWFERPQATSPGRFNLAYNALDRHVVRGLAEEPALLHPFAAAGLRSFYSYAELLERVAQLGGGFRELGVRPGHHVVLALPVVPELVIGLLACARVGAVAVPLPDDGPAAVRRLGHDPALGRPAVVVVDAARKPAVDDVLVEAGRSADYQVVLRPTPGSLDATVGDIDLAVVMRPGAFQPAVCAELPPDSPLLTRLAPGSERTDKVTTDQTTTDQTTTDQTTTYDHGWARDLVAEATRAGWAPGSYVTPADDPTPASPYAALLAPFLVGAAVELR